MDITIGKILSWIFGVLLLLDGIVIITGSPIGGILVALVGIFLLPPVRQWISDEYDVQFSRWVVFIVGIIGIGLFGAFAPGNIADTGDDVNQPTPTAESGNTSRPSNTGADTSPADQKGSSGEQEDTVQQRTHEIGESFTVGDIKYKVTGVTTRSVVGGQFYTVEADGIFVLVDLEITNNAKESVYVSNSHLKLIDSQEREYPVDTDPMFYADNSFSFERLDPGVKNEGVVIFDVPPDQQGRKLRVQPVDLFSTKEPHFAKLS